MGPWTVEAGGRWHVKEMAMLHVSVVNIYIIISMSPVKFKKRQCCMSNLKLPFRRVEFSGPDRETTIQCSMGFYDHLGQDWSVI